MRLFAIIGAAVVMTSCAHADTLEVQTVPTVGIAASQSEAAAQAVLDEDLVSDFRRRAYKYMKLHRKLQNLGDRQKPRDNINENLVSEQALAMRIRFARHDARPGDLFTAPIAMALRRALNPVLRGLPARGTRESIRDDAPATFVLAVNGDYPAGASRSTMPTNVLQILPPLPKGLEYRIVDTHLVLMDLDANIVVDYVLDVMCKTC